MIKKNSFEKIIIYIYLHIILLMYAVGSIFSKLASKQNFGEFRFIMLYSIVLGILAIYAILWQQILKKLPVSTAFANKSVVVIWGMIFGKLIFNESITKNMVIGSVIICIGIYWIVSKNE